MRTSVYPYILIHATTSTRVDRPFRVFSHPADHWLSLNINSIMIAHFIRNLLTIFESVRQTKQVCHLSSTIPKFAHHTSTTAKFVFMTRYRSNDFLGLVSLAMILGLFINLANKCCASSIASHYFSVVLPNVVEEEEVDCDWTDALYMLSLC